MFGLEFFNINSSDSFEPRGWVDCWKHQEDIGTSRLRGFEDFGLLGVDVNGLSAFFGGELT